MSAGDGEAPWTTIPLFHSVFSFRKRSRSPVFIIMRVRSNSLDITPHQDLQSHDSHPREQAETSEGLTTAINPEKAELSHSHSVDEEDPYSHTLSTCYRRYKIYSHLLIWLFFTGSARLNSNILLLYSRPILLWSFVHYVYIADTLQS